MGQWVLSLQIILRDLNFLPSQNRRWTLDILDIWVHKILFENIASIFKLIRNLKTTTAIVKCQFNAKLIKKINLGFIYSYSEPLLNRQWRFSVFKAFLLEN